MSVIPGVHDLILYEGSTFDITLSFVTDEAQTVPKDLTGWSAAMKVRKDYDGAPLLEVVSAGPPLTPGPTTKSILLGDALGTARIYIGSTHMAALDATGFTSRLDAGEVVYEGVWDLELINPSSEVFRYVMGQILFSREVTYG